MINITSDITEAEVYQGDELEIRNIKLNVINLDEPQFVLYQNTPNPFSNETIIGFSLPDDSNYILRIMDTNGKTQKVFSGVGFKGYNEILLESKDVSIGLLYYQLEAGDDILSRKMIVIK